MTHTGYEDALTPVGLPTWTADRLRDLILQGDLPAGTRLGEAELSERFGVSRPPLREGLRKLETEGLAVQLPRQGTFVRTVTLQDAYEIITLRDNLERMAIRLGVPPRDDSHLDRCRAAQSRLEEAAEVGNAARVTEEGFVFHTELVNLAGHGRLSEAYRNISLQMRLCMAMNRKARRSLETLREDAARHRRILTLVETKDPEAVVAALATHGHTTFVLELADHIAPGTPAANAWVEQIRAEHAADETFPPG